MPIQLKRSSVTAVPPSLASGEPAFSSVSNVLFIGVNGEVTPIAGVRTPGVLTPNQAIVTNSSNFIDNINVANTITISNNGVNLTISAPSTGSRIFSNSSLDIFSNNYIKLHSNPNTAVSSGTAQDSNWVIVDDEGIYIQSFDEAGTTVADITVEAGGIKTIGDIISFFPNTYSLGNSSFTWRNVYAGNSVVVGNTLINTSGLAIGSAITANSTRLVISNTVGVQANGTVGSAGQVLTSNATSVYWSTLTTGTMTAVNTGVGLTGGPITTSGTVSVLANSGIVANTNGVFVNTAFIGALTANNTSFVGAVSAANVVSNAQLTANVSTLQSQITSNAATAYSNAVSFVTAQSFANTSQLSANVSTLQGQITSNAATAYSNAVAYVDSRPFVNTAQLNANVSTLQSQITSNAATAYSNAVSYVDSRPFVNTSQLTSNLALYAQLSGAVFTGSVTTNNLTVSGNLTLQGNAVIVGANNLVVNDAVISLHSPANGSPLTSNDGRNIGISFHYYDTEDRHGALLRDNSTGRLTWYSDSTDPNLGTDVTGTILGTIQANTFYAGNSTVFATVNATSYTGTANNTAFVGSVSAANVVSNAQLSANVSTLQSQITSNAATAYSNAVAYVTAQSFVNTAQLNANVTTLQSQITSNAATAYSNAVSYVDSRPFVNTAQLSANLALYATIANPTFTGNVTTGNVIIGTTGGIRANGSFGTGGQVLTSNGTTVYWTTPTTGTVTSVATGNGMVGGPITSTGTVSVLANSGIIANTNGVFVNTAFIGTLTANNTSFVGSVSAANVVSNAQLSANVSTLQSQITSNAATAYTNAVAYVDSRPFVNTAQLTANVSALQDQITSNAATAYSNAVAYVTAQSFVNTAQLNANVSTLQDQITSNAATAFSNAVLYVDGKFFVNTSQLSANVSTLQSQITSNAATAYTNAVAYVDNKFFVNTSQLSANVTLLQSQITSNAAAAYTNAVAYVDSKSYVNTAQLESNLALYATIANPTFTGNVTTGNVIINTTGGIRANGSFGTDGQVLTSNGTTIYWSTVATSGGFTNGQSISVNNFVLTGSFTANSSAGSAGQILISNGAGAYWGPAPAGGGGTVTQVSTGNGLTGGPVTTTGTLSVLANSGIVANTFGVFVNADHIATLTANNTTNFNSQPASFYTNATNLSTGTLPNARLSSAIVNTSGSFTLGGATAIDVSSTSAALRITQTGTGNALLVEDSANPDSSPLVVDGNGRLLVGFTQTFAGLPSVSAEYQQLGTVGWSVLGRYGTNVTSPAINYVKSRSTTIGSWGVVSQNDGLGAVRMWGDDGTSFIEAARIEAAVDATPGTSDMPGRLVFSTTTDGASSPTERMRIVSNGNIGIGDTTPNARLTVTGTANVSGNVVIGGTLNAANVTATLFTGDVAGTANNSTNFDGLSLATVQGQITGNAATAYSNAVSYVTAQSFTNTAQLNANVSTLQSQITSNAATAYSNAVAYVDSRSFVNSSQLSANLALYAQLSGATFTGSVTTNDLTVTGNLVLQGNTVIVAANNLVVNDAVISLHSPANGSPLTSDDGRNIGISFHYYDTEDRHGALLRDNSTGRLTWYSDSTDPNVNTNVTGTILGTIQANTFYAGNSTVFATVNATSYTGTANNATNFGGLSLATVQGQITGNAATAYSNAIAIAANATNLTSGTVPTARLGSGTASSTTFLSGDQTYKTAITSVATGVGLTGGSITTTGTVSVLANSGIVANTNGIFVNANSGITSNSSGVFVRASNGSITVESTGISVNAAYIATLDANNATNFGGLSLATVQGQITGNAATAFTNATNFASNATNITTGTLSNARLPAAISVTSVNASALTVGTTIVANTIGLTSTANVTITSTGELIIANGAGIQANGTFGTVGQVLTSDGGNVYWSSITTSSGTVTQVNTGNGLTGGPVTTTGTVSVLANSGIVANTFGVFVNTAFIGTLTANNSTNFGELSLATVQGQITGNAATAYTNAIAIAANATNLTSGTVSTARLGSGTANSITFLGGDQTYKTAVTSVATGAGLTGGTISTTGTVSVLANSGIVANTNGIFVNANSGIVANTFGVFVNTAFIGTLTANNANNLNSQPASFYTNATNISAGTLDNARLPATINITTVNAAALTVGTIVVANTLGVTTSANINITSTGELVISPGAGIFANGSLGTAGQALFSNGTSIYWDTVAAGVNTAAQFAWTNTHSFAANLTIGATSELIIANGAGIQANGTFGTAAQVLSSNGGGGVYWATSSGGITADQTVTLTNKRIDPRVSSTASATSVTPDISSFDMYVYTALAAAITVNASTGGSPVDGNKLTFRFKDNGTARGITWTTSGSNSFRAVGVTLPTTTVINKVTYVGCIYNAAESFWDVVAVLTQA